jgi:SAM-dependent methyltransferase
VQSNGKTPTAVDYGDAYFTELYGSVPGQSVIDRARDRLIHALVTRYVDGGRLLEIGCGFGYLLSRFDRRWQLCGTDISAHAAAVAQHRLPHAHVVAADIQQGVPFSGQFDVALATNVVEHLPNPQPAAHHFAAAVRPGGLLVVHLPTINNRFNRWLYGYTYERDPTHVYRPSGAEVNQLFEGVGFRTLHALYCPFWPAPVWRALKPHPAYLAVYERLKDEG